jgi:hypothetical protein
LSIVQNLVHIEYYGYYLRGKGNFRLLMKIIRSLSIGRRTLLMI